MEKTKILSTEFTGLISEIQKEESFEEYKQRLLNGGKTKNEIKEELLASKREKVIAESLLVEDDSKREFNIKIKNSYWLRVMREYSTLFFILLWCCVVGVFSYSLGIWLNLGDKNIASSVLSMIILFIFLLMVVKEENHKVQKKLEAWFFEKFEEDELKNYEGGKYNHTLAAYLYKRYQKKNDSKFNSFLLDDLMKKERFLEKMYKFNSFSHLNWSQKEEHDYILRLVETYNK